MSKPEIPDFIPDYLMNPVIELDLGFMFKKYYDGVGVVFELHDTGAVLSVETRFPDNSLHIEGGPDDPNMYIKDGIPEESDET